MKKNWVLFILIFIGAYGFMLTDQWKKQQDYDQKLKQYEIELAIYNEEQRRVEDERERRREELLRVRTGEANGDPTADTETLAPEDPEHAPPTPTPTPAAEAAEDDTRSDVTPAPSREPRMTARNEREIIRMLGDPEEAPLHTVETPLYRVVISELGARPIVWEIKSSQYVTNINGRRDSATTTTMSLIPRVGDASTRASREYPLEVVGSNVREFNRVMFTMTRRITTAGGETLEFTSDPVRDGLVLKKTIAFRTDSYVADIAVEYLNGTERRQSLGRDTGLGIGWQGGFGSPEAASRIHGLTQGVYASDGRIRTRTLRRDEREADIAIPVEWAGQEKKYFATVIAPTGNHPVNRLRMARGKNDAREYMIGGVAQPLTIDLLHGELELAPGASANYSYQLFVGPKNREALQSEAWALTPGSMSPGELVFHAMPLGMSWFRGLCLALLWYMRTLYEFLGVWGLTIIGTTLTVRLIILPLTHWAIKNQARMMVEQERVRPEMQEIMKKYKNDAMKRSQAMMELYSEHKINPIMGPLRGCFPMLLQMPIFIALYVLFDQAVELRGQSFLWMHDLSAPDALIFWGVNVPLIGQSLNILPIIMGGTNYAMMKIMQMPAQDELQEKIQKQMIMMMPIMMVVILYHMPAGLTLYWTVSNVFSIGQSVYTKRVMNAHKEKHKAHMEATGASSKKTVAEVTVEASSSTVR